MTGNATKSNKFAYTYAGGPHGQQYEAFREEVCRNFGQLDIEPSVSDRLDCGVEIVQVGSLSSRRSRLVRPVPAQPPYARGWLRRFRADQCPRR